MPAYDLKNPNSQSRFQSFEIEFGDDLPPEQQKSSPIQKLYSEANGAQENQKTGGAAYFRSVGGDVPINWKVDDWGRGFTLFGDFVQDAKKYYKKTCINADYVYFFSYRPMYKELSHEQLCWYLYWRSKVREGIYPKTGLSYIFLYLYEQLNLPEVVGCKKAYDNIVGIWKNYRAEFPRIDKYIAEWLIDFSFIQNFKINLGDIAEILPEITGVATIPEMYMPDGFFKNSGAETILRDFSVYDYTKSKFCIEKNKEVFDLHMPMMLREVLSCPAFDSLVKKEIEEGAASLKTTRESYMGAVCAYENKKRITVEYKSMYKNFYIRQCITDTARCAENALREFLGIKSRLTLSKYPEQLKEAIDRYASAHLNAPAKKAKEKKAPEEKEALPPPEFKPDMGAAAAIEKESWDTTMTLVELQNRDAEPEMRHEAEPGGDDGDFIAIDTGSEENILDALECETNVNDSSHAVHTNRRETNVNDSSHAVHTDSSELAGMGEFAASLGDLERAALAALLESGENGFDSICAEFFAQKGTMLESAIDAANEKAMDFIGDVVFDMASNEIIEDYREELIKIVQQVNGAKNHD
ncbi:MAG: TerB N-terminal domain-containing protein [Oscillospiraceae bacterium]|nr:TerB N-terminal domain-containing protein [Oscillospiraceae bacterium]